MDSAKQQGRGAQSKVDDGDKVLHAMQDGNLASSLRKIITTYVLLFKITEYLPVNNKMV